jgi:hypothetical protein
MEHADESDQLPEEGPAGQIPDDAPGTHSDREDDEGRDVPGTSDAAGDDPEQDPGKATGNPGAAG